MFVGMETNYDDYQKRQRIKIHEDCLNDPIINLYNRQKLEVMKTAIPYAVVNKSQTQIISHGFDKYSEDKLSKLDILIDERISQYRRLMETV